MEVNGFITAEYLQKVLGGIDINKPISVEETQYYLIYDFGGFKIQLRSNELSLDFWVQEMEGGKPKVAWVENSIPIPEKKSAYMSKCIGWVFRHILLNQLKI